MKLIKQHRGIAFQHRVVLNQARENAFGNHLNLSGPGYLVSSRVRYPTVCPGASPNCFAIYRAADRAASRLGSSIRIFRFSLQGASNKASGTLVVLPAPGGACSRAVVPSFRVCFSSGSMCSIGGMFWVGFRSEEHTSELQSRPHLVCRLLLEKKKFLGSEMPLATTTRIVILLLRQKVIDLILQHLRSGSPKHKFPTFRLWLLQSLRPFIADRA